MHSLKKNWLKSVLICQNKTSAKFLSSVQTEVKPKTVKDEIAIPNKIHRGPTDILKALSQTVKRDPLAPHYKYHDDPYTIPVNNAQKRSYALAQESGRKAAQWIKATHANLFQHKVAQPPIEIFSPKLVYNEEEPVSTELLEKFISNTSVTDAIKTFQRLEKENIEVTDELKQSVLELVCYFNCEDSVPEDLLEERWYTQPQYSTPKYNSWKDNDFAETLFRSYTNPGVQQYASIIQGMLKHNQVEKAFALHGEAKEKGLVMPVDTFNLMLARVHFLRDGFEQRWQLICEILAEMNQARIKPNLGTLNEILRQLGLMATYRDSKKFALRILGEMKKFGVKPSLSSYNELLYLFSRDRGPRSGILYSVLDELEARLQSGEDIQVQDAKDNWFFSGAMEISRRHLDDVNCAYRVDKILHHSNLYNFIGDSTKESTYYRHFFFLVLSKEPFDKFMELYDRLVPNVYTPEKSVMQELITTANVSASVEYFPRIWSELVMLDFWQMEDILASYLEAISNNLNIYSAELVKQIADVAWSAFSKVEELNETSTDRRTKSRSIEWTGVTLGHLINVLLADKRLDNVHVVFLKLMKENFAGIPELNTLTMYLDAVIEEKNLPLVMSILEYISELGFENIQTLGAKIDSNFTLTAAEKTKILTLVSGKRKDRNYYDNADEEI